MPLRDLDQKFNARMQQALNRGDALTCACGQKQTAEEGMKIIEGKPICHDCRKAHALEQENQRRQAREDQIQQERRLMTQLAINQMVHGANPSHRLMNMAVLGKLLEECPSFPSGPEGIKNILALHEGAFDKGTVLDELYEVFVKNGLIPPYPPKKENRRR